MNCLFLLIAQDKKLLLEMEKNPDIFMSFNQIKIKISKL